MALVARMIPTGRLSELVDILAENADSSSLLHGGWYTTEEVAGLMGVYASTLRRWRTAEPPQGPPFTRLSSRVTMYSARDVEEWLAARRTDPAQAAS